MTRSWSILAPGTTTFKLSTKVMGSWAMTTFNWMLTKEAFFTFIYPIIQARKSLA